MSQTAGTVFQSYLNNVAASKMLLDFLVKKDCHSFPCTIFHPDLPCDVRNGRNFIKVLLILLKINVPIHVIPLVLMRHKRLMNQPVETLRRLAVNITRSVLFLTSFVMAIFLIQCYGKFVLPSFSNNVVAINKICAVVSGLGIVFEQAHRRVEMTYFCAPRMIEALWIYLEKRCLIKTIPFQEILTFAAGMGVLAVCFDDTDNKARNLKGYKMRGLYFYYMRMVYFESMRVSMAWKLRQESRNSTAKED